MIKFVGSLLSTETRYHAHVKENRNYDFRVLNKRYSVLFAYYELISTCFYIGQEIYIVRILDLHISIHIEYRWKKY